MSINVNDKNLGHATAYAYYKAGGGTMTEAEFTEFMADFGTASQTAVEAAQAALASKNAAQTAATTATNKASEATTAATTATNKAAEAQADADAAALDASQAMSAASTATTKATEATTAAATATSAKTDAVAANTAAQSAKTAAQTAQTGAETAAASVQSSVAQIATNTSDISELKEDFATMESDGVVPSAEQILTDKGVTDSVPYHYRKTGGDGADRLYDQIVGGTVCWNQLVRDPLFEEYSGSKWGKDGIGTSSISDGVISITPDKALSVLKALYGVNKKGHKYFMSAFYKGTDGKASLAWYGSTLKSESFTGSWQNVATVFNSTYDDTDTWQYYFQVVNNSNLASYQIMYPKVCDLTAMFGSTIADYIYSLETATATAGVAWLKAHFPRIFDSGYIPYNAGTLEHVSGLSAHKMVGFNQWDGTYEAGKGILPDGSVVSRSGRNLSDYIRVIPNTAYYLMNVLTGRTGISFALYDADKTFITADSKNGPVGLDAVSFGLTIPYNCCYIRIVIPDSALTSTCINLSDPARNGQYEPYKAHSYSLDSDVTLRGIPKLDANNNLYYDGDEYMPDGTVTRRYGIVDLGTLNWGYSSAITYPRFNLLTPITGAKGAVDAAVAKMLCGVYQSVSINQIAAGSVDKSIAMSAQEYLWVRDTSYTDLETFKAAMSGQYLVYELATPTTEEAEPYQHLQQCDPNGTEEYVSTGIVPVGHETRYPENLKSKIEGLPWNFANLIAPTESAFVATRNYTTGALFIVNNVLYKATSNIANGGTITPNTNCTATTLAEIISALA